MGYVVYCSGSGGGVTEAEGQRRVGLAIKEYILQRVEKDGLAVEYISARFMKVRLYLKEISNGISFVIAYTPTDSHKSIRSKDLFSTALGSTGPQVPKGGHLPIMMDASARSGRRREGCVDDTVLGAYRRDMLSANGRRLQAFSAEKQLALVNTFSVHPRWNFIHIQSSITGKDRYLLDYILTLQTDRRLVQTVTVRRPPVAKPESDNNLVAAHPVACMFCP